MTNPERTSETVQVSRIFLSLDNPRHAPVDTEAKAITLLCEKEAIYPLARDIVRHGLNPLEKFALIPTGKKLGRGANYYVAEGNRRICALKLLNDPELAPANPSYSPFYSAHTNYRAALGVGTPSPLLV